MLRVEKERVVEELSRTFQENSSILLIGFAGVSVPDETELRSRISQVGSQYRVIKNRLALRAAENTVLAHLKEHFCGPTAMVCTTGDPVALAKVLKEFMKSHPGMSFKVGIVEGRGIPSAEVESLADMPSRTELLTKLLFLLNAPLTRLATALQAPLSGLASVLKQLEEKKEKESQ
jgi:large subunit ribosomal protein L10